MSNPKIDSVPRPDVEMIMGAAEHTLKVHRDSILGKDQMSLCAYILHLEQQALAASARIERLQVALRLAKEHTAELCDAWQRGCISEHDGLGGTRSNRNWDVDVKLRRALDDAPNA